MDGLAMVNADGETVTASASTEKHEDIRQRWYIETVGGPGKSSKFYIRSALDKSYIAGGSSVGTLSSDSGAAQAFTFSYTPNGSTYAITLDGKNGTNVQLQKDCGGGAGCVSWKAAKPGSFKIFSVSYH